MLEMKSAPTTNAAEEHVIGIVKARWIDFVDGVLSVIVFAFLLLLCGRLAGSKG